MHIVLATIDLSFHRAAAGVVQAILRRHGVSVTEIRAPHEKAFKALEDGTADMLCSAWLPGSHGGYFNAIEQEFEKLTVLYTPYALWGVPKYVFDAGVHAVADLLKPKVLAKMRKHIQGVGPGAGISRFSAELLQFYRLSDVGYVFQTGSLQQCVSAFESAVSKGEWVVVPLWKPQYLFHSYDIRELQEPNGLLRGKDEATLVVRKSRLDDLPVTAVMELRRTVLGNDAVTELDYMLSCKGLTENEIGQRYLVSKRR